MMTNLNSVLLEGTLQKDPEKAAEGSASCRFHIIVLRWSKEGDTPVQKRFCVPVQCHGRLADVCLEYLRKGREVRIVGRLAEDEVKVGNCAMAHLALLAEHVEFNPQRQEGSVREKLNDNAP